MLGCENNSRMGELIIMQQNNLKLKKLWSQDLVFLGVFSKGGLSTLRKDEEGDTFLKRKGEFSFKRWGESVFFFIKIVEYITTS